MVQGGYFSILLLHWFAKNLVEQNITSNSLLYEYKTNGLQP